MTAGQRFEVWSGGSGAAGREVDDRIGERIGVRSGVDVAGTQIRIGIVAADDRVESVEIDRLAGRGRRR